MKQMHLDIQQIKQNINLDADRKKKQIEAFEVNNVKLQKIPLLIIEGVRKFFIGHLVEINCVFQAL